MPGLDPATARALDELRERARLPAVPLIEGARSEFRHRARLAVRGRKGNPKIGIFQLGTHRVVHIPNCQVHHPLINQVAEGVRRALIDHDVPPYSDLAHAGRVRYLQFVVERASQSVQLVIVTNDREPHGLSGFFADLSQRLGPSLHSLFWNGQPERSNNVLGPYWQHVSGPPDVLESFQGVRLHYPPGAFGQSHLALAERIAERVAELVPDGARIAEFYAGVGAIGLPLVERARTVLFNELGEESLVGLERGLAELPAEQRAKTRVLPGTAGDAANAITEADVVIADPPRKGLDAALLDALIATPPARFIYVSCGLPSLLAQARTLLDSGKFKLTTLEAFALFPYTEHVETLAVFEAVK